MSEQAKILLAMEELIMEILKSGSTTEEQGKQLDALEDLMYQQNSYKEIEHEEFSYQGEEVTSLFLKDSYTQAIEKLCKYKITPDDFFGFVEYHYEDDDFSGTFTDTFMSDVKKAYLSKCDNN